jgi:membrane fusion protein (multidrug efflux system)
MIQMLSHAAKSKGLFAVLITLVLLSLGGATGIGQLKKRALEAEADKRAGAEDLGPKVLVTAVGTSKPERTLTLPADVVPLRHVVLHAKVAGYLKDIRVDKGDAVKRNQVLAVLESPETDHQVASARTDLIRRRQDAVRARSLGPAGAITQQEVDGAEAALGMAEAGLASVRALQDYQVIRAPFDGVVSVRYVDPGALLQASLPVLEVVDLSQVKVTLNVGQDAAPFVRLGDMVTLKQDERPDLDIRGTVTKLSPGLDRRTRTRMCEVWLDNADFALQPWAFVHATLHLHVPPRPSVPADSIFARGNGLFVALIKDNHLEFVRVEPGFSDGASVQVQASLEGNEKVALNLPSDLSDGDVIQPVESRAAASAKAGAPAAAPANAAAAPPPNVGASATVPTPSGVPGRPLEAAR